MNKLLSTMRENSEQLLEMKAMSPDGKLPKNAILNYKPPISYPTQQFKYMKELDMQNEKRPKNK